MVLRAYALLLYVDFRLRNRQIGTLYKDMKQELHPLPRETHRDVASIVRAIDIASVFYYKRVLCLQRSAVAMFLLRENGYDALLMVGAQRMPFKSHAWVEIDGIVVNDSQEVKGQYVVLEGVRSR